MPGVLVDRVLCLIEVLIIDPHQFFERWRYGGEAKLVNGSDRHDVARGVGEEGAGVFVNAI